MKNLSLLKPYLHTTILQNAVKEKATYLNIPTAVDLQSLKRDIKMGARQFEELTKLIEKENEPKYIMISTNNLEQGYMAVTYLAAGFNRKHGMIENPEWDERLEETENDLDEWGENNRQIPVIQDSMLRQSMGDNSNPFAMGDVFMQGNQNGYIHQPYWMDCVRNSVCIVSQYSYGYGCSIGFGDMGIMQDDPIMEGLNHFSENEKVYIIIVDDMIQASWNFDDDDDDDGFVNDRGKWNYIALSYAADEAEVKLDKNWEKKYYKALIKGIMESCNISIGKGFSYERMSNLIIGMKEQNKCKLTENIINYAVKDWKSNDERPIVNSDFSFMERFCRAGGLINGRKKENKKAMERMMTELVGMEEVKKQVIQIVNVMKYNQIRSQMNFNKGTYHNVHVMLGAPGTAKTTVAQFMGQIMVEEHLLPDNRFTCVNGAELKGMYVGHSAPKTKALFEENDIIVIDEAYSLVGDHGQNDSFSKEALAQLIIELENHSTDKLVIFAGYGGKKVSEKNNMMKAFLDANPGIKSRITSTIYFDSYSPEEMVEIFMRIAHNQKYIVDNSVRLMVEEHFKNRVHEENFGNGREARSLLETAVVFAANRVLKQEKKNYTKEEMQLITREDVKNAIEQVEYGEKIQNIEHANKIGF